MDFKEGEVNIHPQFPLTIKTDTYWDECPVCLLDEKTISKCILLECSHRFCSNCIDQLNICCICATPIPAKETKITITINSTNDELWLDCKEIKYMYYISYVVWKIFGCINKLSLMPLYKIDNCYDEGSKYAGHKLNMFCEYDIRGYNKTRFIKLYVGKIIMNILACNGPINEQSFFDFMLKRFDLTKESIIDIFNKIEKDGYLENKDGIIRRA